MSPSTTPAAPPADYADHNQATLAIRAEHRPGRQVFLAVWVAAWAIAGFSVLLGLAKIEDQTGGWWLLFWAVSLMLFAYALAWVLTGREVLRVNGQGLDYELLVLGMARGRRLTLKEIHAVTVSDTEDPTGEPLISIPFRLLGQGGSVQFSVAGRRHSLGFGVAPRDAELIVEWMHRYVLESPK